jgi:ABC-type transport system involved in multi-copper enzyme maturation permease subunit
VRALVAAEVLKLRTARAWIGYLLAVLALSAIVAAAYAGSADLFGTDESELSRDVVSGSTVAGLVALLVGIVMVTAEWRHGTITRTFLVMPRRLRVLVAKEITALLVGAALAVVGVVVVLAVGIVVLSRRDASFVLDAGVALRVGQVVLASALWGAIGVGVGALVKSQTFALVAAILWFVLVEGIVVALLGLADLDVARDFLPGSALGALDGSVEDQLSPVVGGLVGVGYAVGLGALGYLRISRSDIT